MTFSVISERSLRDGAAAAAAGRFKIQGLCTEYCFMEIFIYSYVTCFASLQTQAVSQGSTPRSTSKIKTKQERKN